ncbi:MAG TPA: Maf family protein [Gemmatimonadaceae bacterium]|nr:Maf family protein [Gemmatimonadaceae bacterium]
MILASSSPRRHDLLQMIGVAHDVIPADIDETQFDGEPPVEHVERLAREKGAAIAARFPESLVISADTIVVERGDVLGKPRDAAEARTMLRRLSGRTHIVFTAVAVTLEGSTLSAVEEVSVTFLPLSDRTIASYVATGEPMDKAGSYGIQGYGATLVARIDGDFFAVMGLPLARLIALMMEMGVEYDYGGTVGGRRQKAESRKQ